MTNHITTTPTLSAVAMKTRYHILRRTTDQSTEDATGQTIRVKFELVYQDLEATSAEAAIKYFATGKPDGNHDKAIEGTYVAVPSRSFVEKTVKVETTTTVKTRMSALRDMEVLRVKPGERLIFKLPAGVTQAEFDSAKQALDKTGLGTRSILVHAGVEIAVIEPEEES